MCWRQEAGERLGSECQRRSWQHSAPREGYIAKREFSCPTRLSCKTDNSGFGKLQVPHYLWLWYFSHPLCQLCFFSLSSTGNNASLLQHSHKGGVTQQGELEETTPLVTTEKSPKSASVPLKSGQAYVTELARSAGRWWGESWDWPSRSYKKLEHRSGSDPFLVPS